MFARDIPGTQKERRHDHRGKDGSAMATSWRTQQPPEAGRGGSKFSPKPAESREREGLLTLTPCLRPSEADHRLVPGLQNGESTPAGFLSHRVYGKLLQQQREANTKRLTSVHLLRVKSSLHSGLAGPTEVPTVPAHPQPPARSQGIRGIG